MEYRGEGWEDFLREAGEEFLRYGWLGGIKKEIIL